jgi:hypothetical protein
MRLNKYWFVGILLLLFIIYSPTKIYSPTNIARRNKWYRYIEMKPGLAFRMRIRIRRRKKELKRSEKKK